MRTNAFLDRVARFDGILVGDSDYTRRRALHLEWAQTRVDVLWNTRAWTWRLKPVTLTIPADRTYLELPTDFIEFGVLGSVQDTISKRRLEEVSPIEIETLQQQPPTAYHYKYAVWHRTNTASPAPRTPHIHIGANAAIQTWLGFYLASSPTLIDTADAALLTGLEQIPENYVLSILLTAVKSDIMQANGDARFQDWERKSDKALDRLVAVEGQGRNSTVQSLPRALPVGMW